MSVDIERVIKNIKVERVERSINVKRVQATFAIHDGGRRGEKGDPGEGVPTGGTAGQVLTKDSSTDFDTSWQDPSAAGDVVGPASSTDNAITRFDGTTGKLIQNSDVIIDDDSNMTLPKDSTYSTGYVEKGVIYPAGVDIHWNYTQTATPVLNNQLSPPTGDPVDTSQSMVGAGYRVIWDSTLQDNMPFIGSLSSSGFFGPQGVFHLQGILRYTHNQSNYGMGPIGFADQLIMQNQSGSSIMMAAGWQYIGNRQYVADNGTVTFQPSDTFEGTSAFVDNTVYRVANGGTFDGQTNNIWHVGFASIPFLLSDTSMHRVTGFMASEINGGNLSDIGDVNEWVGFHARQYSASGKNIGLLNESGTVNKYLVKTVPNASTQLPTNATFVELNNTSGGPLTLTSTPTISNNPMDGQTITFLNSSASSITLQSNTALPGSKLSRSITLAQGDQVTYNWNSTLDSWQMYTTTIAGQDHGLLAGLSDDDHTQYALLAGRSGGQTLSGSSVEDEHLTLKANAAAFNTFTNTGRIKITDQIQNDGGFTISHNNSGFFNEWYYYGHRHTGTITVQSGGNIGTYASVYNDATIVWSGAQILSSIQLFDARPTLEPTISSNVTDTTTNYRMFFGLPQLKPSISTASTWTGTEYGVYVAAPQVGIKTGSHASAAVVMPRMYSFSSTGAAVGAQTTVTDFSHFLVRNVTNAGTITRQIGLDVEALTGGTTDIGVRLAKADTYTLQLSDTGGTAAGGITFGTDTNLYRSAANTLSTDDDFEFTDTTKGIILKSPDGSRFRITVANDGSLTTTEI